MKIRIIVVGRKPEASTQSIIDEYLRRLPRRIQVSWEFIAPVSGRDELTTRKLESAIIQQKLSGAEFVALLDERGKMFDNNTLAEMYQARELAGQLTFIVGGAFGVADELRQRANLVWSLSPLVLPHQLVWIVLAEQIYRTTAILANHPYHHE